MIYKRVIVTVLSFLLIISLSSAAFAETIYEDSGFKYTIISNNSISICGFDNSRENVTFPSAINNRVIVEIADKSFYGNDHIKELAFSKAKKLNRIGMFAFSGCTGLNGSITIPSNVTDIGVAAFEGCSNLTSVYFKAAMSSVPEQCFNKCSSLSYVFLRDGIKTISDYAFADCSSLKTIDIPKTVTSISSTAFKNDNLTIRAAHNSYAESYARNNGFSFEYLDVLPGDANANGVVDVMDVTYIQKYKALFDGYDLDEYATLCADVNKDDKVNIRDATLIQMYIAKVISAF